MRCPWTRIGKPRSGKPATNCWCDSSASLSAATAHSSSRTRGGRMAAPVLQQLLADADVLHIHFHATNAALRARLLRRKADREPHPSHHPANLPTAIAFGVHAPLQLDGDALTIPTDDFGSEQYPAAVVAAVSRTAELTGKQRRCRYRTPTPHHCQRATSTSVRPGFNPSPVGLLYSRCLLDLQRLERRIRRFPIMDTSMTPPPAPSAAPESSPACVPAAFHGPAPATRTRLASASTE